MFFYLSKILWIVVRPLHLILIGAFCAWILYLFGWRKASRALSWAVVAFALVIGFTPVPDLLLRNLENSFQHRPLPENPFGVIVLGGAIDTVSSGITSAYELGDGSERLFKALELARKYPDAKMIYTGGNSDLLHANITEADVARNIIVATSDLDLRFTFENESRNTWENAVYTAKIIGKDADKPWILVTSAFHMKRALGSFEKQGINVYPLAVDYRAYPPRFPWIRFDALLQFKRFDTWIHEMIGLFVYRLSGKAN